MSEQKQAPTGAVPWAIKFQMKDLLTACWGSKKGADLLYHFLLKASWERKNKDISETLKDIKFQESPAKALEKCRLSLGSYHTYLKHFVSVGYISKDAYSDEYTVHLDVIEAAFTNSPEKPVKEVSERRQSTSKSFNLKDCNFVTLPREEYELLLNLKDECFKLKEMFQSLKDSYAQNLEELKEMFQSLKQNPSIYENAQASAEAIEKPQSYTIELDKSNALEREYREQNSAVATFAPSLEDTPFLPDFSYLQAMRTKITDVRGQVEDALVGVNELKSTLTEEKQQPSYSPEEEATHDELLPVLLGTSQPAASGINHRAGVSGASASGTEMAGAAAALTSGYEKTGEQDGTLAMATTCGNSTGANGTDGHGASEGQPLTGQNQHTGTQGRYSAANLSSDLTGQAKPAREATGRTGKGESAEQPALIVEKKPMTIEAQIDATLQVLDHVRKQASGKPFGYVHSGAAKGLLKDLIISCKDTPNEISTANITLAWMAMWNAPRWSNGMSWQDPGKLTIAAFCRNYGEYVDIGRQGTQKQQEKPGVSPERKRASSPHVPGTESRLPEEISQRNKERLKARYDAIMAAQAAQVII